MRPDADRTAEQAGAEIVALADYLRRRHGTPGDEPPPLSPVPARAARPPAPVNVEAVSECARAVAATKRVRLQR